MSRVLHLRRGAARCAPTRQSFRGSASVILWISFAAAVLNLPILALAQKHAPDTRQQYARETDSETLWTSRFAHCDYGFYVLLPEKFVGHSNLPPNPCHGFSVGLPDTSTTNFVGSDSERFIWVNAEYNSLEWKSLEEAVEGQVGFRKEKPDFRILGRNKTRLNGRADELVRFEYTNPRGKVVEEQMIALRSGIVYEIGLVSTPISYAADRLQFTKIVDSFRWWKIHYCS